MKARAAILYEVGQKLDLREIDVEGPRAGEVLVKMVVGGLCHSDLHVMTGHLNAPLPAILGHEGAGTVVEVGPGVTTLRPGDNVIPLWRLSCGECEQCTSARPALCDLGRTIRATGSLLDGTSRFSLDGSSIKHFLGVSTFSEYTVIMEKALVKIPEGFPLQQAALLGCGVITGIGSVTNAAKVKPGSLVVVFGSGGVGLNVIQGAALAGAAKIIAVDLLDNKLDLARQFGATHTVNASSGDPVEQVRSLTAERGVDYAFEVVGSPKILRQAFDCLAKRGVAVAVGVTPLDTEVSIPIMGLIFEERSVIGSVYGSSRPRIDIPKLMDLYGAGKLKLDELLTRTYPFEQINEAYEALQRGEVARTVVLF